VKQSYFWFSKFTRILSGEDSRPIKCIGERLVASFVFREAAFVSGAGVPSVDIVGKVMGELNRLDWLPSVAKSRILFTVRVL
jgi:hypothetical protein